MLWLQTETSEGEWSLEAPRPERLFTDSLITAAFLQNTTRLKSSALYSLKTKLNNPSTLCKSNEAISGWSDHQISWNESAEPSQTLFIHLGPEPGETVSIYRSKTMKWIPVNKVRGAEVLARSRPADMLWWDVDTWSDYDGSIQAGSAGAGMEAVVSRQT